MELLSRFSMADYQAAIQAAPPGTLLKLGDLDKMAPPQVRCTTCGASMDEKAAQFHKHPKSCEHCKKVFDENTHRHVPIQATKHVGAGTVVYTSHCQEEAL